MATINPSVRIADDPRAISSDGEFRPTRADMPGVAGGVFNTRSRSRAGSYRSGRGDAGDEEGDEWQGGNEKKKQVFKGRTLLLFVSPLRTHGA